MRYQDRVQGMCKTPARPGRSAPRQQPDPRRWHPRAAGVPHTRRILGTSTKSSVNCSAGDATKVIGQYRLEFSCDIRCTGRGMGSLVEEGASVVGERAQLAPLDYDALQA